MVMHGIRRAGGWRHEGRKHPTGMEHTGSFSSFVSVGQSTSTLLLDSLQQSGVTGVTGAGFAAAAIVPYAPLNCPSPAIILNICVCMHRQLRSPHHPYPEQAGHADVLQGACSITK